MAITLRTSLSLIVFVCAAALCAPAAARAADDFPSVDAAALVGPPSVESCRAAFDATFTLAPNTLSYTPDGNAGAAQPTHPKAYEYSDAYQTRAKIHRLASWATLPLFVADSLVGQSLYSSSTDTARTAHAWLGAGIIGLFGVNSVTGIWNLVEGWDNPEHRTLRTVHGIMMLAADAGFVAAWATSPSSRHTANFETYDANRNTHRAIALTSMGVATASYLMMLIGNR